MVPAWSLKIFEPQPLPSMQLLPSFILDAMEGAREGGGFSVSKGGQPDLPSKRTAYNVGTLLGSHVISTLRMLTWAMSGMGLGLAYTNKCGEERRNKGFTGWREGLFCVE